MRGKGLLAAFLLGVGLCFVPVLGYGEVPELEELRKQMCKRKATFMELVLSGARIDYITRNPTNFLGVFLSYDEHGVLDKDLPEGVDTEGKLIISIEDTRGVFSDKSEMVLLRLFRLYLKNI